MITMKRVQWIMDCLINGYFEKLTDWEQKFVIDIESCLKKNNGLTDSQAEKLEEVYERVQQR